MIQIFKCYSVTGINKLIHHLHTAEELQYASRVCVIAVASVRDAAFHPFCRSPLNTRS